MRTWLNKLRTANKLTMADMANRLGISLPYYSLIESGQRQKDMNLALAAKIAKVGGVTLDEIARSDIEWRKEAKE